MYTDNPILDAQSHIHSQREMDVHFHKCDHCNEKFPEGHGVKIEEEKFCNECISSFNHFDFYRECGCTDAMILEMEKTKIEI